MTVLQNCLIGSFGGTNLSLGIHSDHVWSLLCSVSLVLENFGLYAPQLRARSMGSGNRHRGDGHRRSQAADEKNWFLGNNETRLS